jgi:hypothetical protein
MQVEQWPIDQVKPYHRNPRHNDKAVDRVAISLQLKQDDAKRAKGEPRRNDND